jgi:hypothetical protein
MKSSQILKLADLYLARLSRDGLVPKKHEDDRYAMGVGAARAHIAWACTYAKALVNIHHEPEIARQWIGFIQGAMWMLAEFTIDEMRQHDIDTAMEGKDSPATSRPEED